MADLDNSNVIDRMGRNGYCGGLERTYLLHSHFAA